MKYYVHAATRYIILSMAIFLLAWPRPTISQHAPPNADAQKPPLLPAAVVAALDQELSGETAKRNLEGITRFHRMRGSRGFRDAAELVAERARAYGLTGVTILSFPADGRTFYGTQKSRLAWDADFAELWEMREQEGKWTPAEKMASFDAMPVTLAEDSESADVTADLIDVGQGIHESDYEGKDVRGKIVLVAAQPGAVQELAVGKYGAAGIVSYALNQPQAWQGEDENLIRWGHLESFSEHKTFVFMVSLKTARALRERLAHNERIRLHAIVKAGQHPGELNIVTATIPGADPKLRDEEIAFSCHLDHQRPGANDNASGCVTILEIGRTLAKLIAEGKIERPARTLRFIWPPEIEGTTTLLNARPEFAKRIKAVVHLDMVGGGPATKAIFHVTRGPMSLPSFIHDVAEAFADFVNRESDMYASTGQALYPFVSPEGGKEALQADFSDYTMGSDHDVYQEGSFRIPAIYMNDWPDRYIHTNGDVAANIDPTKLKRAAFIGAASAYFLANMKESDASALLPIMKVASIRRCTTALNRSAVLSNIDGQIHNRKILEYEEAIGNSLQSFTSLSGSTRTALKQFNAVRSQLLFPESLDGLPHGEIAIRFGSIRTQYETVFHRSDIANGPMAVFGYDYLTDHLAAKNLPRPKLLDYQGLWGSGEEYAYEALSFVDGKRDAEDIRWELSAEYGPVSSDLVLEYLKALESIGVLKRLP